MKSTGGIQVIARAADILRQLKRDNSGQSLGAIAAETGLPRSTVQRIVNALIAEELVSSSGRDGDLRLGPEVQSLAAAGRMDVASMIRPALERLSADTGETVDLAIFAMTHMTFIDQIAGRHRLSAVSVPGEDFPLSTTANGKAVLALLTNDEIGELFIKDEQKVDLAALLREVERIRAQDMAFDLDEHTLGISAAGIAFQTVSQETYAVSIPAPTVRFNEKRAEIEAALSAFLTDVIDPNPYFTRPVGAAPTVQDVA